MYRKLTWLSTTRRYQLRIKILINISFAWLQFHKLQNSEPIAHSVPVTTDKTQETQGTVSVRSPKDRKRNDAHRSLITHVVDKFTNRRNNRACTLKPDMVLVSRIRILAGVLRSGEAGWGVSRSTGSLTAVSR